MEREINGNQADQENWRSASGNWGSPADSKRTLQYGIEPDPRKPDLSLRLLSFLERARTIKGCRIAGLPAVIDFGISRRSLLLVVGSVDGTTLPNWLGRRPSYEERVTSFIPKTLTIGVPWLEEFIETFDLKLMQQYLTSKKFDLIRYLTDVHVLRSAKYSKGVDPVFGNLYLQENRERIVSRIRDRREGI